MLPDGFSAALNVTRSFSGRRWRFRETNADAARALQRAADISPALAQLLCARNVAAEDVKSYLNPTLKRLLPEPFVLVHMEQAVTRAAHAIIRDETVAVFGDYDVDGSCSAALLHDFLAAIGRSPLLYVPDRLREGYGPNAPALLGLKEKGASLVITVDCGAGAPAALIAALTAGLDVIVLDHHAVDAGAAVPGFAGASDAAGQRPAIPGIHVNPNQPDDESGLGYLCAAGVTFLFLVALNRELRNSGWYLRHGIAEPDLRRSVDLVGLATVCDVVPLIGVNRAFVRAGVSRLSRRERPGIAALAAVARAEPPFSFYECGFVFGPRINAGGRVGRCSLGVELLTAQTENDAARLAGLLDLHNRERQALETAIVREAIATTELQSDRAFLLVSGNGWHPGVVGLVASRLKDRFHKPALAIGFDGETAVDRPAPYPVLISVQLFAPLGIAASLMRAVATPWPPGFHSGSQSSNRFATGLLRNSKATPMPTNRARIFGWMRWCRRRARRPNWRRTSTAPDHSAQATPNPCSLLRTYGSDSLDIVGQGHVRLRLQGGDGSGMSGIAFRVADTPLGRALLAARGERIHAAGFLRARRWNGRVEAQLQLEDAAPACQGAAPRPYSAPFLAPFVYRLGLKIFNLARGVRLP